MHSSRRGGQGLAAVQCLDVTTPNDAGCDWHNETSREYMQDTLKHSAMLKMQTLSPSTASKIFTNRHVQHSWTNMIFLTYDASVSRSVHVL